MFSLLVSSATWLRRDLRLVGLQRRWCVLRSTNTTPPDLFDPDDYFDDVGKAFREEIDELYELGCRECQVYRKGRVPKKPIYAKWQATSKLTTQPSVIFATTT